MLPIRLMLTVLTKLGSQMTRSAEYVYGQEHHPSAAGDEFDFMPSIRSSYQVWSSLKVRSWSTASADNFCYALQKPRKKSLTEKNSVCKAHMTCRLQNAQKLFGRPIDEMNVPDDVKLLSCLFPKAYRFWGLSFDHGSLS